MPDTWSDPYSNVGAGGLSRQYQTKKASNANEQVLGLYQSSFGRSASVPEVETWVRNATNQQGASYLTPEQLNYIQSEFRKSPEYQSYTGPRPTVNPGDFIGGVTLGTSLADDPYFRQPTIGGGLQNAQPGPLPAPAEARPTVAVPSPMAGTVSGQTALSNTGAAQQETTTAGLQSMVRDRLINLMDTPTPTANDPNLSPAISAFNAAQNRATARQVNQNAEAFGAQGLESSGARLAADRGAIEQQGLNEGTFSSNLVLQQLESQRQQAMQGLQMALAVNDQDLSRRLQDRLAQLNATLQREGLAQQGRLGQADIDLRQKLGTGNLNLGALQLAQQGRQFNDSLGFNVAQLQAQLNNQALTNLLYGG